MFLINFFFTLTTVSLCLTLCSCQSDGQFWWEKINDYQSRSLRQPRLNSQYTEEIDHLDQVIENIFGKVPAANAEIKERNKQTDKNDCAEKEIVIPDFVFPDDDILTKIDENKQKKRCEVKEDDIVSQQGLKTKNSNDFDGYHERKTSYDSPDGDVNVDMGYPGQIRPEKQRFPERAPNTILSRAKKYQNFDSETSNSNYFDLQRKTASYSIGNQRPVVANNDLNNCACIPYFMCNTYIPTGNKFTFQYSFGSTNIYGGLRCSNPTHVCCKMPPTSYGKTMDPYASNAAKNKWSNVYPNSGTSNPSQNNGFNIKIQPYPVVVPGRPVIPLGVTQYPSWNTQSYSYPLAQFTVGQNVFNTKPIYSQHKPFEQHDKMNPVSTPNRPMNSRPGTRPFGSYPWPSSKGNEENPFVVPFEDKKPNDKDFFDDISEGIFNEQKKVDKEPCECVEYYLCRNGKIIIDGYMLIDTRFSQPADSKSCPGSQVCCSLEKKTKGHETDTEIDTVDFGQSKYDIGQSSNDFGQSSYNDPEKNKNKMDVDDDFLMEILNNGSESKYPEAGTKIDPKIEQEIANIFGNPEDESIKGIVTQTQEISDFDSEALGIDSTDGDVDKEYELNDMIKNIFGEAPLTPDGSQMYIDELEKIFPQQKNSTIDVSEFEDEDYTPNYTNENDKPIVLTEEDGKQCECVYYYLCDESRRIIKHGEGLVDLRYGESPICPDSTMVCCEIG